MTLEIGFLLFLLAVMAALFLTEKIAVDLTAFSGLLVLIFGGYLTAQEAFSGFASSAVITMLSIFIVSAALLNTGVADEVGRRIHTLVGGREVPLVVVLMAVGGGLSAFMNNIAATAVLMPAVSSIARRSGLAPSRLFMPLAFGSILGGTTTLVGTPPNIVAAEVMRERGLEPFGLFDFTPLGVALLALGVLFMATVGRRILPSRETSAGSAAKELGRVYQLREKLFSIRIPAGSPLDGSTLGEIRLGEALAVQVVAILRDGQRRLAPEAEDPIHAGDILLVQGELEDVRELFRVRGLEVEATGAASLPRLARGVSGIRLALEADSPMAGKTLRDVKFRERYGMVVLGISRDGQVLRQELGLKRLRAGDEILALGTRSQVAELAANPDFTVREVGLAAVQQLQEQLFAIRVPAGSPLVGASLGGSRIGELVGLTVGGIVREGATRLAVSPDEVIREGDQLLVAGEPTRILHLLELGEIQVEPEASEPALESEEVGVVEATLAPRSTVAGHSLAELDFRERFGLQVLAIWREGHPLTGNLARRTLRFGDALLLQGPREKIALFAKNPNFVLLTEVVETPRRKKKAPLALGALTLMVALVVLGVQPIQVAAFTAAVLCLLGGALSMSEAYLAIEWRAIFLVAAILPVGIAMERTGAALLLADAVAGVAGPLGPHAVLASMVLLSSLLSQALDGAPAVVLLSPVVIESAMRLQLSPYPFMMAVSLAASAAFMTPFSHKANLLVMGVGGYRAVDYIKVGSPLTVAVLLAITLLTPLFFAF